FGLKCKKINNRTYAISPEKEKRSAPVRKISTEDVEDSVLNLNGQTAEATSATGLLVAPVFTISGTVKDESNFPLPGVNILVKGTNRGTTTDVNGAYSLEAPDGNIVLVFSFIGYETQEVNVENRSVINISLVPDVQYLSEVAVIGYGTVKKSDLTGSVAQVKAEELNSFPT